jgi:hypothetical protein
MSVPPRWLTPQGLTRPLKPEGGIAAPSWEEGGYG